MYTERCTYINKYVYVYRSDAEPHPESPHYRWRWSRRCKRSCARRGTSAPRFRLYIYIYIYIYIFIYIYVYVYIVLVASPIPNPLMTDGDDRAAAEEAALGGMSYITLNSIYSVSWYSFWWYIPSPIPNSYRWKWSRRCRRSFAWREIIARWVFETIAPCIKI